MGEATKPTLGGTKLDQGKPQWGLLPAWARTHRSVPALVDAWWRRTSTPARSLAEIIADLYPRAGVHRTESNPTSKRDFDRLWVDVVRVLEHGAKKYGRSNWERGMQWSRAYDAFCRHWRAIDSGEVVDPEFGLPHEAHALCELVFLAHYELLGSGEDDRPAPRVPRNFAEAELDPSKHERFAVTTVGDVDDREYVWGFGGARILAEPRTVEDLPPIGRIAESLSGIARWNGYGPRHAIKGWHWTVAHHCIFVMRLVEIYAETCPPRALLRAALLHDAHEAIYGDASTVIKRIRRRELDEIVDPIKALGEHCDRLLEVRYALAPNALDAPAIKTADVLAAYVEALDVMAVPQADAHAHFARHRYGGGVPSCCKDDRLLLRDIWALDPRQAFLEAFDAVAP